MASPFVTSLPSQTASTNQLLALLPYFSQHRLAHSPTRPSLALFTGRRMFDVVPYAFGIPAFYFFYHVQSPAIESYTPKAAGSRADESRLPYKKTSRQHTQTTQHSTTHHPNTKQHNTHTHRTVAAVGWGEAADTQPVVCVSLACDGV